MCEANCKENAPVVDRRIVKDSKAWDEVCEALSHYFTSPYLHSTPFHPDDCGHGEGSYVVSFLYRQWVGEDMDLRRETVEVDLYVDGSAGNWNNQVCLRTGRHGDYVSPGNVVDFMLAAKATHHQERQDLYKIASDILYYGGFFSWSPLKEGDE